MYFDTHVHLNSEAYEDVDEIVVNVNNVHFKYVLEEEDE